MNQNNFKVGDWVTHQYGFIDKIEHIREGGYILSFYEGDSIMPCLFSGSELELWQPKQGEWCWFWNNEKDLTLQKFWKTEQNYFIVAFCEKHKNDEFIFYDVTENHFKNCEPFIGELPSFLK